jgi:hypothetical protein
MLSLASIVAVHGLGANPEWAWVWKVNGAHDQHMRTVNWLQDLLPEKIPYARILTFNYESKWHNDAPKQRRTLCADQLLIALHSQRIEVRITILENIVLLSNTLLGEDRGSPADIYWPQLWWSCH